VSRLNSFPQQVNHKNASWFFFGALVIWPFRPNKRIVYSRYRDNADFGKNLKALLESKKSH
jgi:hypothetical protein